MAEFSPTNPSTSSQFSPPSSLPTFPRSRSKSQSTAYSMLLCMYLYVSLSSLCNADHQVCPICSNTLTISRGRQTETYPTGQNRLECKTCAYNYDLTNSLYERKVMKKKEVEDVLGGKDAWENVDKTSGKQTMWSQTMWSQTM